MQYVIYWTLLEFIFKLHFGELLSVRLPCVPLWELGQIPFVWLSCRERMSATRAHNRCGGWAGVEVLGGERSEWLRCRCGGSPRIGLMDAVTVAGWWFQYKLAWGERFRGCSAMLWVMADGTFLHCHFCRQQLGCLPFLPCSRPLNAVLQDPAL